jgi:uncharacterized membrane protein YdfJ with MMPL/SSD domain
MTERLARAASRHPWRALGAWLAAIVVALGLSAAFLPGNLTTNGHSTNNPESAQAEKLFQSRFPPDKNGVDELIVVSSPGRRPQSSEFRAHVQQLLRRFKSTDVVYRSRVLGVSSNAVLIGIQRQRDVDKLLTVVRQQNGVGGYHVVMTG